MLRPKNFYDRDLGQVRGIEVGPDDLTAWWPVVTQVRQVILDGGVVGTGIVKGMPDSARSLCPTQEVVGIIAQSCERAIQAGRLIDFGEWTNDVIKYCGKRGGSLYGREMIGHPFREPYVFMHTWEGETAIYLVNLLEPDKPMGGDCECVELQPMMVGGNKSLMIADRVMVHPTLTKDKMIWENYAYSAIPSIWRVLYGEVNPAINGGKSPAGAAAGNVLDPMMTALLILSTRGIARETVSVDAKLTRARMKNGKPPIPPFDRVHSAPYVTAISNRKARGRKLEAQGGHHASPVMHIRMGHPRTYANGVTTFVRDALVNATDDVRAAWAGNRSHYTVRG